MGSVIWVLIPGMGKRFFSSPKVPRHVLGPTQSPVNWLVGFCPQGIKHLVCEVNHLTSLGVGAGVV